MPSTYVQIPTPDGVANAYFTRPDGAEPAPGVIVYSDAFGLRPELEHLADRLAATGYAVLVPNVYYRGGADPIGELPNPIDLTARPDLFEVIGPLMASVESSGIVRDAGAYLEFLAASPEVADGPVGTTGYCMGTRFVLRTAQAFPARVAAAAAFHGGGLATDDADSPHRHVDALQAEVYLAHADHDEFLPPEQIARLDAALTEAGVRYRTEVYTDAPHGFAMADTTAYREDAEKRHFAELTALLQRTLVGA